MNILLQFIYKCSEWFMYIISYLVNELHLNYFVMILTVLITGIATCLISLFLRLFGINDSIENDKKILGLNKNKNENDKKILGSNKNKNENKLILKYKHD